MAAVAAAAFGLVALVAPGAVRSVLDDDLLETEAQDSSVLFEFEALGDDAFGLDDLPFDLAEVFEIVDGDLLPIDPDVIFDVGDVFDGFGPDLDEVREQVRLLSGIDQLQPLTDAAGGTFVVDVGFGVGAVVDPDGDVGRADSVSELADNGVPVMTSAELNEYVFDDLGVRVVGLNSFIDPDPDRRTIAGVVEVDDVGFLVAADASAVDRSIDRVQLGLWLAVPLVTMIAAAAAWLLTARVLRPVGAITDHAAEITAGSLDSRVPVPDTGDEIHTLALTVNEMLDRLESDDRTRRRFVSDASHELRSPVAVMRTDADVALRHPETANVEHLATVVAAESARLTTIIDDLLSLARADEGVTTASSEVDLDDIVLAQAARRRRVPVDTTAVSAGRVHGRADELSRLVGHLLDNAARHARTRVATGLRASGDGIVLTVDDDGPSIAEADRERVFERFVRLDEARSRDDGGAGLGLAVVRSTAERSGGSAAITSSPSGGTRVVVTFPG
jgi:signal transduction histidine kinase